MQELVLIQPSGTLGKESARETARADATREFEARLAGRANDERRYYQRLVAADPTEPFVAPKVEQPVPWHRSIR